MPCRIRFERSRSQCPSCGGTNLCAAFERKRWMQEVAPTARPYFFDLRHFLFGVPRGNLTGNLEVVAEPPPTYGTPTSGIVVGVDAALEAPLSRERCVGYRLVGRVEEHHGVDDADLVPFAIDTAEGERIHVVPDPAALDVEVGDELALDAKAMKRVAPFLALRGLVGERMRLAQGLLCAGDRVQVWGDLRELGTRDEGYRGSAAPRVLTPGLGGPLVIRPRR